MSESESGDEGTNKAEPNAELKSRIQLLHIAASLKEKDFKFARK